MLVSGTKNNSIGSKIHKNEMLNVYTYLVTISSAHYASQSRASQLKPGWRGPQLRAGSEVLSSGISSPGVRIFDESPGEADAVGLRTAQTKPPV